MTRKKWNRLRRQYPSLFKQKADLSWERLQEQDYVHLRCMSKREVIAEFTAQKLSEFSR